MAADAIVEARANPAKRSLLNPGKWHVIHDPRSDQVEFYSLEKDPQALEPIFDLEEFEIPPVLQRILRKPIEGVAQRTE